ncbi:MAG: EFR1 family ferrodoxin [Clostridia bacterium]|nr:EFR1 family ferrodoxin [Clostridia bacterium]MDY5264216.1 EFR1 family ferrodoxin [Eubacteriales bacterium]
MNNVAIIYFSGTGNTRYVAHRLKHELSVSAVTVNICKELDFDGIIKNSDYLFFCYPVYGSMTPKIMDEFVLKYADIIKGKEVGVVITQGLLSGDGAMDLARKLQNLGTVVTTTEHFIMPDNLCDVGKPITDKEIFDILNKTNKKINDYIKDFENGKARKRGNNPFSRMIGGAQRVVCKKLFPRLEQNIKLDNERCIGCGWCKENCPTTNITIENGKAKFLDRCTLCYRCVNGCPKKAIAIMGKKTESQYKGLGDRVIP